jgi:hypothetical protein
LNSIEESNKSSLAATQIIQDIWKLGLANGPGKGGNPFDEYSEKLWSDIWLFYSNSIRFASAMGGGGDYGVFADARYHLKKTLQELQNWLEMKKPSKK